MTAYTKSSQSIWQKIRNLFSLGYEKITRQELQIANAMRGKLSGIGYTFTRIVFFVVKLATLVVLAWLAIWFLIIVVIWFAFRFFTFNKMAKQYREPSAFTTEAKSTANKRTYTYDNDGNLLD